MSFEFRKKVKNYADRFPRGHWSFLGPREEDTWCGTHTHKLERSGMLLLSVTVGEFQKSGDSIFSEVSVR